MEVDHTRTKNIPIRIKDEIVDNLDESSKIIDQIRRGYKEANRKSRK